MSSPVHHHHHHHHHGRSSSAMSMRRPQNTKAAAQRLARVMANQSADDDEEEDDLLCDFNSAGIGLAGGRQTRTRSPLPVGNSVELPQSLRPTSSGAQPSSARSGSSLLRPVRPKPVESYPSPNSLLAGRSPQPADESHSPSARSNASGRSPSYMSSAEQPSSARFASLGRPNLRINTVAMPPSTIPQSLKPLASGIPPDPQSHRHNKDKRLSLDFGTFKYKDAGGQQSSALQDELDMLQEENDSLLEKLRIAEERFEEAETRTRQLEKQIASLGEGVSLEARLLSRKEADLQKREVALKVAAETYGGSSEETASLRMEIENAREEATSALDQLHEVEKEVKSLRTITQRMILTRDEMEELVLKRCWLARCWSLCVRYGIHAEIAGARHEYWSNFASRPVEVILAAGRKAKDENAPSKTTSALSLRDYNLDQVNVFFRRFSH
ncbi:hypothetical protein ACS0TY_018363 [Phlomoides rotata]